MTEKLNDKSIWDEIYRKTDNKPGWDLPGADRNLLELIQKYHIKDKSLKLLDVGCGNGRNEPLAEKLEEQRGIKVNYFGTDFSESAVEYCKLNYPHRDFHLQDICTGPAGSELYEAGPYNIIMDCGCFHAIPPEKREDYKKSISALCENDGLFVIGAWFRTEEMNGKDPQYYPYLYLSEWFFNEEDIRQIWHNEFELIEHRVDKEIYPEMFEGFAYFVLRKK